MTVFPSLAFAGLLCSKKKSLLGGGTGGRAAKESLSVPSKKLIKSAVHIPNTSAYRPRNVFKNEILSWLEQKANSIKVSQWSQASFKTISELLGAVCRTYVIWQRLRGCASSTPKCLSGAAFKESLTLHPPNIISIMIPWNWPSS